MQKMGRPVSIICTSYDVFFVQGVAFWGCGDAHALKFLVALIF